MPGDHSSAIGLQFGRLVVTSEEIRPRGTNSSQRWCLCQCECGHQKWIALSTLRAGNARSCGCLRREVTIRRFVTHGRTNTPEYGVWLSMKNRCYNRRVQAYPRYGGRGITVCERWMNSFEAFFADLGPRPSEQHSIERIDSNGPYSPENCRWATATEQYVNRRQPSNWRVIEFNGRSMPTARWAREAGLNHRTLYNRLIRGWSVKEALTTKPMTPKEKSDRRWSHRTAR